LTMNTPAGKILLMLAALSAPWALFAQDAAPAQDYSPSAEPTSVTIGGKKHASVDSVTLGKSTETVESVTLGQNHSTVDSVTLFDHGKSAAKKAAPKKVETPKAAKSSKPSRKKKISSVTPVAVSSATVAAPAVSSSSASLPLPDTVSPSTAAVAATAAQPAAPRTGKGKKSAKKKKISSVTAPAPLPSATTAQSGSVAVSTAEPPLPEYKPPVPEPDPVALLQKRFAKMVDGMKVGRTGSGMRITVGFTGASIAEDFQDITSPIDGSVVALKAELFKWTNKGDSLGAVVSPEVAALIASSPKGKIDKDLGSVYSASRLKAPADGLIVKVNVANGATVYEGDRLLTIARRFYILAKTDRKLFIPLQKGMDAWLTTKKGMKVQVRLTRFSEIEGTGRYMMRLEVVSKETALEPGMVFSGEVVLLDHPQSANIPAAALFTRKGKTYMFTMTEVTPGARDGETMELAGGAQPETEFIYPSSLLDEGAGK